MHCWGFKAEICDNLTLTTDSKFKPELTVYILNIHNLCNDLTRDGYFFMAVYFLKRRVSY